MWSVWRTVLEENEKLARARLAAVEVFQQQIADDAKVLRAHKLAMAKKVCCKAFFIILTHNIEKYCVYTLFKLLPLCRLTNSTSSLIVSDV